MITVRLFFYLVEDNLMDEQLSIGEASFSQESPMVPEVFNIFNHLDYKGTTDFDAVRVLP